MCNVLIAICIVVGSIVGWLLGSAIITNDAKTKHIITNKDPDQ